MAEYAGGNTTVSVSLAGYMRLRDSTSFSIKSIPSFARSNAPLKSSAAFVR